MALARSPAFAIRPMAEEDLAAIARIEVETFPAPWPYEALAFELKQNPCCASYVCELGGQTVAYAFLWVVYEQAHLVNIAVDSRFRGQGLGEALLVHLISYAARNGAETIHLEVRESNEAAVRLYEKHGFCVLGRKEKYYGDGETALQMEARLLPSPDAG